jgi:hypothetical protein
MCAPVHESFEASLDRLTSVRCGTLLRMNHVTRRGARHARQRQHLDNSDTGTVPALEYRADSDRLAQRLAVSAGSTSGSLLDGALASTKLERNGRSRHNRVACLCRAQATRPDPSQ